MLESLKEFTHESLTDEQRAAFTSYLKDISIMLEDETLTILLALLED